MLIGDLGEGFTYARLDDAFRCLMDGAELLALQKNRYWLEDGALHLDAGPFVAALEYASGKQAAVVGKPERSFFDLALREIGLEAEQAAMIGDDAGSDVAGAKRAGLGGFLVKTGKLYLSPRSRPAVIFICSLLLSFMDRFFFLGR